MGEQPSDRDLADPRRIRSLAVHREDVANALEATLRSDSRVVLRVTPPFSGRMRARIHRVSDDAGDPVAPIHVDAADLVDPLPAYPEVDDTVADHPNADVETRRERHAEAVAEWRTAVREAVGGSVELAVDAEEEDAATHAVDVTPLG
jgi:hypothetical protein